MGPRPVVPLERLSAARAWLRSRGPVTLAAALLLEVSSATSPSGPHARALFRAALLGLALIVVLVAAALEGLASRGITALQLAAVSLLVWTRTYVLGQVLPAPIPDALLIDARGRQLRGAARKARVAAIERQRAGEIRQRSLRGRAAAAMAWLSRVSEPLGSRLGRNLLALEAWVIAARAWTLTTWKSASAKAAPTVTRAAGELNVRSTALWQSLRTAVGPRAALLRTWSATQRAALPSRTQSALQRAVVAAGIASRSLGRLTAPLGAIPIPSMPVRTLRVVTLGLLMSFVFATVIGTTGLVATRGSIALGASTTLSIISGEVVVSDGGVDFRVASDGEVLQAGSTIKTGPDTYAILTYFEGSTVSIDPNTILVIEELLANSDGTTIIGMRQDVGQTWHAVTKLLTAGSKYEVRTTTATATVRGTLFLVGVRPGADPANPEMIIETTEGAVGAIPNNAVVPELEEVIVTAGFQVTATAEEPIPPPVPQPEPERKVTVTVGTGNSLVVDPQGRANGERDGKIVVQTPGATVERIDGQIVVTLPNTTDGTISTLIQPSAPAEPGVEPERPAPVQVTTVVQERGRGESRSEETVERTAETPTVTGVKLTKGTDQTTPPDVRRLEGSEIEVPVVKVAQAPAPSQSPPPVARAEDRRDGDEDDDEDRDRDNGDGRGGGGPDATPTAGPRGLAGAIVSLTLPPLSADDLARRDQERRESEDRERREREREDEKRRKQDSNKVDELRRDEAVAVADAARASNEREREESRQEDRRADEKREDPAPSPATVLEQIFRSVAQQRDNDDEKRKVEDLRKAEEEAAKKAEKAAEERRKAEERLREQSIKAEEAKRKEAEKLAEELRKAEEKAKQEEARTLEQLRKIEEKAKEQAAKLEAEQRREAERRLEEFKQAEERKRREESRALEEQRREQEREREKAERKLEELRREQDRAREREQERERERERDRDRDRDRDRRGFTPRETLQPLPGPGSRSVDDVEIVADEKRDERERADRDRGQKDDG